MIKSFLYPFLLLISYLILGLSIYSATSNFSILWLIIVLTQLPFTIRFTVIIILKLKKDKDPKLRILTSITLSGLIYCLLELIRLREFGNWMPLASSSAYTLTYVLVSFWLPKLDRHNSELLVKGKYFPEFVSEDQNRNPVSSTDLFLQPCLFIFYRGNWCPFCMIQLNEVKNLYKEIENMGVKIILVSPQDHKHTQELAQKFKVDFTYLVDKDLKLSHLLHLVHKNGVPIPFYNYGKDTTFPTVVFTNEKGKIIYADQTDNISIRPEPQDFIKIIKQSKLENFLENKIGERTEELQKEKQKSEKLLLNILPHHTAIELKETGSSRPRDYEKASVLFTDFKGFTKISEKLAPNELIKELDLYFGFFDSIATKHNLERIKTIGDAYMCAGGLPISNETNPIDSILSAIEMQNFMKKEINKRIGSNRPLFELRIGIHTGHVIAGVVGTKRFAFDIWGDTVNLASRMESSGEANQVNISEDTYQYVKYLFKCEYRGMIQAKNKGEVKMYFVNRIKPEYSADQEGIEPNKKFIGIYEEIKKGIPLQDHYEINLGS